jgi:hypothetical protein
MADEDTGTRFECRRSRCKKTFAHKTSQANHEKKCCNGELIKPTKPEKFTCTNVFCTKKGKEFTTSFSFKRHMQNCKPKVKSQLICLEPYCGRIFNKPFELARHAASHNKETYTCEHCWTEYTRIDKFKIHQKRCSSVPAAVHSVDPTLPSMVNNEIENVVGDNQSTSSAASVEIHSIDPTSASTAIRDHGIYFSTQNDSILNHSTNISVSEEFTSFKMSMVTTSTFIIFQMTLTMTVSCRAESSRTS